jgi:hypothetical protein
VVNATTRPLSLRKREAVAHFIEGFLGPRTCLGWCGSREVEIKNTKKDRNTEEKLSTPLVSTALCYITVFLC